MPRTAPKKPDEEGFISRWTKVIKESGTGTEGGLAAGGPEVDSEEREVPRKGQRWETLDGTRTCRVMCAPVEGYVMARYPGAVPWVMHINDWHKKFKRKGA